MSITNLQNYSLEQIQRFIQKLPNLEKLVLTIDESEKSEVSLELLKVIFEFVQKSDKIQNLTIEGEYSQEFFEILEASEGISGVVMYGDSEKTYLSTSDFYELRPNACVDLEYFEKYSKYLPKTLSIGVDRYSDITLERLNEISENHENFLIIHKNKKKQMESELYRNILEQFPDLLENDEDIIDFILEINHTDFYLFDEQELSKIKQVFEQYPILSELFLVSRDAIIDKSYRDKHYLLENQFSFNFDISDIEQYPQSLSEITLHINGYHQLPLDKINELKEKYNITLITVSQKIILSDGREEFINSTFSLDEYINKITKYELVVDDLSELDGLKYGDWFEIGIILEESTKIPKAPMDKTIFTNLLNKFPKIQENFYIGDIGIFTKNDYGITLNELEQNPDLSSITTLRISSITELSSEQLVELQTKYGIDKILLVQEDMLPGDTIKYRADIYSVPEYIEIYNILKDIVDNIPPEMSEEEKVMYLYDRISKYIEYDIPAAYPSTPEEEIYSKKEFINCSNLKNGLLYKKCICGGYAEILRSACKLAGIKAEVMIGPVDSVVPKEIYEIDPKYKDSQILEELEGGLLKIRDWHAWNKIQAAGNWYNFDACWDHSEEIAQYAFKSDEDFAKKHNVTTAEIPGIRCDESKTPEEISSLYPQKNKISENMPNNYSNESSLKKFFAVLKKEWNDMISNPIEYYKTGYKELWSSIKSHITRLTSTISSTIMPTLHKTMLLPPSTNKNESENKINPTSAEKSNLAKESREHNPFEIENFGITREEYYANVKKRLQQNNEKITKNKEPEEYNK